MIIENAYKFAFKKHKGQVRRYTNEPYFNHPYIVALTVAGTTANENVWAAALLHDVLEDTETSEQEILDTFNQEILDLVLEVTDISKPEDGNRAVRKEIDRQHLFQASPDGQTIKLADLIDNSRTIIKHDPKFAKIYIPEKKRLMEALVKGNPRLFRHAVRIIGEYETNQN